MAIPSCIICSLDHLIIHFIIFGMIVCTFVCLVIFLLWVSLFDCCLMYHRWRSIVGRSYYFMSWSAFWPFVSSIASLFQRFFLLFLCQPTVIVLYRHSSVVWLLLVDGIAVISSPYRRTMHHRRLLITHHTALPCCCSVCRRKPYWAIEHNSQTSRQKVRTPAGEGIFRVR